MKLIERAAQIMAENHPDDPKPMYEPQLCSLAQAMEERLEAIEERIGAMEGALEGVEKKAGEILKREE